MRLNAVLEYKVKNIKQDDIRMIIYFTLPK